MKQKIVMQMKLDCDKCRSKALKLAAQAKGVSSVALEGDEKEKLVVTGDVDAVCLGRILRKKFQCVTLVSVEEVKKKEKEEDKSKEPIIECKDVCYYPPYCPPPPYYCPVVYDPYPYNTCSIM